jgi:cytochrome c oxidase subunit III
MSSYAIAIEQPPSRGRIGMWGLIAAESAIFSIFLVAYIFYLGKSLAGPQPADVLHAPVFCTICMLLSSLTIHLAARKIAAGEMALFGVWWISTILLGGTFLFGTAREWRNLIVNEGLTISTNLFGTTYFSLVGLHAFHVIVGLLALILVAIVSSSGALRREHAERIEVLSMYWHFVDAVWVVVFTVVYVIGVKA